jgi:glycosyltransferase involved in cell wall biosynthesis
MQRKYRILHLITRLDLGGAQQNTLFCTAHHDRRRFEVELIAGAGGILDDEARRIPDARVQVVPWLKHAVDPPRDVTALLKLGAYLKSRQIDLLHTHSSKAGILGRWAAHLAGVPSVVHTVHGWSFNETQPPGRRRAYIQLEKLTGTISDRLIVVASRNREQGLTLGIGRPEQYELLHSGIDADEFNRPTTARERVREALGFDSDHVVVGTLCCLKPQKAPLDFVRAAAAAHEKDQRLRFFIAGDGEQRSEVEALSRELGVTDVVRVLGWRRDAVDLLHAMDLFLLTSRYEGLPRAVLQAMAAGVPVIATAVDGTPEIVEDGRTGVLVPAGRPDEVAAAILRLAEDSTLRAGFIAEARQRLDASFDIRVMVRRLDRLYLSLLNGNSGA